MSVRPSVSDLVSWINRP